VTPLDAEEEGAEGKGEMGGFEGERCGIEIFRERL